MEPSVKTAFTKAIAICGDDPAYENVKDFMQDMIDEDVSLASKDTPVHLLRFIQTAAYNTRFSEDFRKCMADVLFQREIDDKATMFHLRKLIVLNHQKDERIRELEQKLLNEEQYKNDQAEQIRMSEMKSKGMFGPNDQVDEVNRMKRLEEHRKDDRIQDLEDLVHELEMRVEKLREINDNLHEEIHHLNESRKEVIEKEESEKKAQKEAIMEVLDKKGGFSVSKKELLKMLRSKNLYGDTEDEIRLNKRLDSLERKKLIKHEIDGVRIIRKGYNGEEISEYDYQRWHNHAGW